MVTIDLVKPWWILVGTLPILYRASNQFESRTMGGRTAGGCVYWLGRADCPAVR